MPAPCCVAQHPHVLKSLGVLWCTNGSTCCHRCHTLWSGFSSTRVALLTCSLQVLVTGSLYLLAGVLRMLSKLPK